jgi:hypothetical protein
MKRFMVVMCVAAVVGLAAAAAQAAIFNGQADNQVDQYGYYYVVTGGLFPTGNTPNGDNASGGTFRFLTDDPGWGYPIDAWQKDDWFSKNASIALTLTNSSGVVYDNNGLENGSFPPGYYTYGSLYSPQGEGAYVGYSMSNNYDWIYAGYFDIQAATTVTQITGYFLRSQTNPLDVTGGFDPNNPALAYHMNFFSNVSGNLLPVNTGSFAGDVFSSDTTPGSFSWSDTGYDRTGSTGQTTDIYSLTYTLDQPLTLQPGVYWFSHDATIVPEPATIAIWSLLGGAGIALGLWRRKRTV